jgi:hypothetical protein
MVFCALSRGIAKRENIIAVAMRVIFLSVKNHSKRSCIILQLFVKAIVQLLNIVFNSLEAVRIVDTYSIINK